jgi:putative transcriptional regulator
MEKLKELRLEKGYTFSKMAKLVGLSKPFYWQIEHNQRRMTYDLAVRISKVFGLKPDDVFYEEMKFHKDSLKPLER